MHFPRMLLVFIALIGLACSLPSGTQYGSSSNFSQNGEQATYLTENKQPLVLRVEEKNPKSESVVVEFVYSGNSANIRGTNKDKYAIDSQINKENNKTSNANKKMKSAQTAKEEQPSQATEKSDTSLIHEDTRLMGIASLSPEENSAISGKWPKYYYENFNPIQPFPELQYEREKRIYAKKLQGEMADSYPESYVKERKETVDVAGPQLNPLSMFEREFRIPIFD